MSVPLWVCEVVLLIVMIGVAILACDARLKDQSIFLVVWRMVLVAAILASPFVIRGASVPISLTIVIIIFGRLHYVNGSQLWPPGNNTYFLASFIWNWKWPP